ncbi:MAG: hypothetical protein JWL76_761 [Thermoleophilia bacterium]|nr:hypothetical protein [Thermoleophilia bacterium]
MTHVRMTTTIGCAPRATVEPVSGPTDRDDLGTAMGTLGRARIKLAGTISELDFRLLLELRRDMVTSARLLRTVAKTGGMFPNEYRAGANDALRAARTIGRANVEYDRFTRLSGGPYGIGWPQFERRMVAMLTRARADMDRAYAAAYTGTHY